MPDMQYKTLPLTVKTLQPDGSFQGEAAYQGNVDHVNDRLLPGSMTKTISRHAGKFFLLADHVPSLNTRIGLATLRDGSTAIAGQYQLNLKKQAGREAYEDLLFYEDQGLSLGLSIGFQTKQSHFAKDGVREISELELYEISLVTWPANDKARARDVKSDESVDGSLVAALQHLQAYLNSTKKQERPIRQRDASLAAGLRQMKDFDESTWAPVLAEMRAWQNRRTVKTTAKDESLYVYGLRGTYRRYPMGR
jgi:HK97 family phage prohead protease